MTIARMMLSAALFGALAAPATAKESARDLSGTHSIDLVDGQGAATTIGEVVVVAATDGGYRFEVVMADAPFEDNFLSMKPFKCLPHPAYLLCHLPYPYENARNMSADDLSDLEYDLLFIRKTPSEYGINPYNGIYYRLSVEGDAIVGVLHETDLDVLAAPPDDGDLRPITADALYEAELEKHAFPKLLIR